jgi:beta-lactamase class A
VSPRYRLYDPRHYGGLWVGKDYAKSGLWRRDPLHNLSHGATAMQVARFYYLLKTALRRRARR